MEGLRRPLVRSSSVPLQGLGSQFGSHTVLDVSSQEKLRSSGQGLSHLVDRRAQGVRKLSRQTARTDD